MRLHSKEHPSLPKQDNKGHTLVEYDEISMYPINNMSLQPLSK